MLLCNYICLILQKGRGFVVLHNCFHNWEKLIVHMLQCCGDFCWITIGFLSFSCTFWLLDFIAVCFCYVGIKRIYTFKTTRSVHVNTSTVLRNQLTHYICDDWNIVINSLTIIEPKKSIMVTSLIVILSRNKLLIYLNNIYLYLDHFQNIISHYS